MALVSTLLADADACLSLPWLDAFLLVSGAAFFADLSAERLRERRFLSLGLSFSLSFSLSLSLVLCLSFSVLLILSLSLSLSRLSRDLQTHTLHKQAAQHPCTTSVHRDSVTRQAHAGCRGARRGYE